MDFVREYLDTGIFLILGIMSVLALATVLERWLHYRRVQLKNYEQLESLKLDLSNGLVMVATVASNAPYVGLLGTVFGIMLTFYDIGQSGQIDTQVVMVGLALALKATALGLIVAIPAMIMYNALVAKSESLQSLWLIEFGKEPQT